MLKKLSIFFTAIFILGLQISLAEDLSHDVAGIEVEDVLASKKLDEDHVDPYLIEQADKPLETTELKSEKVYSIPDSNKKFDEKVDPSAKYKDFGFTIPGSLEDKENYLEIDKKQMSYEFRRLSESGINIAYYRNDYSYQSPNDIINQTVASGYKHVQGGMLAIRSDNYIFHTFLLNSFWSVGSGIGYNSGRGIFVTGERSDMTFRLWEVPLDLGLGLEIPIYHWFKIVGVAGPSGLMLYQNRSDFKDGEKGKNKAQFSYGKFASAQFKINLSGFNSSYAYDLFTKSNISNLFLNLEARYHVYENFQDQIKISGTSFGVGFTFEYL